ncbi:putative zinc-binding metallopeptidase [Seonamhaeicola sp.]|uniref:putative zinc-binding metallopeptidase n=1 Tax=Seonamhaeicola sp. TaxID=1912245 RepID=UPI00261F3FC2|nr:putative zinc-binding metallopeptidase [Seonamhaeicola sp.]
MKNLKHISILAILFSLLFIFNSCNNEDIYEEDLTGTIVDVGNDPNDDGDDDSNGSEPGDDNPNGSDGDITLYRVEGDNIVKVQDYKVTGQDLVYQQDIEKHQHIWDLTKKVVPPKYRSKMSEFLIFNGEPSGTAGFVVETSSDLSKWQMAIAINYSDDEQELIYTIIHEFAHILTLNNDQVNSGINESSCNNFFTGEGCSKQASYINKLYGQFWADIWGEYLKASDSETGLDNFYNKYERRFVTQYASTNPGEDIAEVFAVFVTRNGGVNGNSIAEQKIQLMYDHPELVSLRDYIRNNLGASRTSKGRNMLPAPGSWKHANTFGNPKKSHCSKTK